MIGDFTAPASDAPLDWALSYATAGMSVFPVSADKKPLVEHGVKDATIDKAVVRSWWGRWRHAEIAWAVPADIVVVDLDCKRGENGLTDFVGHEGVSPDEVTTPQATTPSGGRHIVYSSNGASYRNGVRINGSAIDLRTAGGYIVLPGPGNGRSWLRPLAEPLAPVPQWVAPAPAAEGRPQGAQHPFSGETAYARAALRHACLAIEEAPNGAQEATLNKECYSIGGLVGVGALDYETAIAALFAAADLMPVYADPWRDLEAKVRRAVQDGMRQPRERPGDDRQGQEQDQRPEEPKADGLIWYGDGPMTPPAYSVEETLPETGVAIVGGQYGAGKTFVGGDLAAAIIVGGEFAGKPVNRTGGVLWFAAEGESEIEMRVHAAIAARGGDATQRQPFAHQAGSVPCLSDKDAPVRLKALANAASERMRKDFGCDLALIEIDTLSAAAGFDDENSAAETQKVMTALAALARETKTLIVVIDHYGKLVDTGVRGSSAKSASADAILACLGDRDQATGETTNRRLAVAKLRRGPTGRAIPFDLAQTADTTTCTVKWADTEPEPVLPKGKAWPKALLIFKRALDEALGAEGKVTTPRAGMPEVRAVDREAVRDQFMRLYVADTPKAKSVAFIRCAKDAIERGIMCSVNVGPDLAQTIFWTPEPSLHTRHVGTERNTEGGTERNITMFLVPFCSLSPGIWGNIVPVCSRLFPGLVVGDKGMARTPEQFAEEEALAIELLAKCKRMRLRSPRIEVFEWPYQRPRSVAVTDKRGSAPVPRVSVT